MRTRARRTVDRLALDVAIAWTTSGRGAQGHFVALDASLEVVRCRGLRVGLLAMDEPTTDIGAMRMLWLLENGRLARAKEPGWEGRSLEPLPPETLERLAPCLIPRLREMATERFEDGLVSVWLGPGAADRGEIAWLLDDVPVPDQPAPGGRKRFEARLRIALELALACLGVMAAWFIVEWRWF